MITNTQTADMLDWDDYRRRSKHRRDEKDNRHSVHQPSVEGLILEHNSGAKLEGYEEGGTCTLISVFPAITGGGTVMMNFP